MCYQNIENSHKVISKLTKLNTFIHVLFFDVGQAGECSRPKKRQESIPSLYKRKSGRGRYYGILLFSMMGNIMGSLLSRQHLLVFLHSSIPLVCITCRKVQIYSMALGIYHVINWQNYHIVQGREAPKKTIGNCQENSQCKPSIRLSFCPIMINLALQCTICYFNFCILFINCILHLQQVYFPVILLIMSFL